MELGQKLKQARLEAGLSQRQLCGGEITRNMLSQIENGSARPSMDTLRYLAGRLGKPISYFLEEQTVISPNQKVMAQARAAFGAGAYPRVLEELTAYHSPDPVFDWERFLLWAQAAMALAEQVIAEGRMPYALQLLEQAAEAGAQTPYYDPALERKRLVLLAEAGASTPLPDDDRALLLRAKEALAREDPCRAVQYLDAAEDHRSPQWDLLRGQAYLGQREFRQAYDRLKAAEEQYPKQTAPLLEHCCRELEDYKGAYFYACKVRELER